MRSWTNDGEIKKIMKLNLGSVEDFILYFNKNKVIIIIIIYDDAPAGTMT